MDFYPYRTHSGYALLGASVVSGLITAMMFDILLRQPTPPQMFQALVGLLVLLAFSLTALYWTVAAFTLRYHLNRNGLTIYWGWGQQRIPFDHIQQLCRATPYRTGFIYRFNLAGCLWAGPPERLGALKFGHRPPAPMPADSDAGPKLCHFSRPAGKIGAGVAGPPKFGDYPAVERGNSLALALQSGYFIRPAGSLAVGGGGVVAVVYAGVHLVKLSDYCAQHSGSPQQFGAD